MATIITVKIIEAALKAGKPVVLDDEICSGLKLSVSSRGGAWSYRYRLRGVDHEGKRHPKRTIAIGTVASHNPTQARAACDLIKEQARSGTDIVAERKATQAKQRTLLQHAEAYMATLPETDHGNNERRNLRLGIAEMKVGKVEDVSVATVRDLVTLHRDKPAVATHRLGALRRFLQAMVEDAVIAANPAMNLAKRNKPSPPAPRTTVPTASQIQALWNADFGTKPLGATKQAYVRTLILLPLRMNELASVRAQDIVDGMLILPGHVTKNGDDFSLPIPPQAQAIIDARMKLAGKDGLLFPLTTAPEMKSWSKFRTQVRKASGINGFGFHALRRAFLTECVEHELGDPDLADSLLNHRQAATRGGIKSHYLHARRTARRKAVMNEWAGIVTHAIQHGRWPRELEKDDVGA